MEVGDEPVRDRSSSRCGSRNSRHEYRDALGRRAREARQPRVRRVVDQQRRIEQLRLERQRPDDRVDQLGIAEPVVLGRIQRLVDAGDRGERVEVLADPADQLVARVARQRHRLAQCDPELARRVGGDRRLIDGHLVHGLGSDVVTRGHAARGRNARHVPDVILDPLLDPEPDERRVGGRLLDPVTPALDHDVAVVDEALDRGRDRRVQVVAGFAHPRQGIVSGPVPEDPVLDQHDRAGERRRVPHLGPHRLVGKARQDPRREGREQRGDEHERREPDRGATVIGDPVEGHPRPAHGYSSLARRTALVRAEGSWRTARTTVASTRSAARATVGTAASGGTTITGAGTGGSPVGVSVANGSTR